MNFKKLIKINSNNNNSNLNFEDYDYMDLGCSDGNSITWGVDLI